MILMVSRVRVDERGKEAYDPEDRGGPTLIDKELPRVLFDPKSFSFVQTQ
jgi:hypothetical protein